MSLHTEESSLLRVEGEARNAQAKKKKKGKFKQMERERLCFSLSSLLSVSAKQTFLLGFFFFFFFFFQTAAAAAENVV